MIQFYGPKDDDLFGDLAPDLTPMMDILFILLVFFMLTAGTVLHSLELTLPSSVAEELEMVNEPKHIMLEVGQTDFAIDGKKLSRLEDLKVKIATVLKRNAGYDLIIAGDEDVSMGRFLSVLTYLQSQGIQAANILMQKEESS